MTLNQATKRLEKMALHLEVIRGRIEALTKDMSAPKAAKSNGKRKRKERPDPIGATVNYGGLEGKVVEREGDKFIAEMSDGKRRQISVVYVYRQLGKKGTMAKASEQAAPQDQPAQQTVTHDQLVAKPTESVA